MTQDLFAQFEADHSRPRDGRVLIVGSHVYEGREDRRALYADSVGVDVVAGPGVDFVGALEELVPELGVFDHAECLSVMEHSPRPWALATAIEEVLVPGGTLLLSVPFVWRFHGYPHDYFRFTHEGVKCLFPRIEWSSILYVGAHFRESPKLDALRPRSAQFNSGPPYFPRTQIFGFGVRR